MASRDTSVAFARGQQQYITYSRSITLRRPQANTARKWDTPSRSGWPGSRASPPQEKGGTCSPMTITTSGPTSAATATVISQMRNTQDAMSAVPETPKRQTTQIGARTVTPATTVTSGLAQHPGRPPTKKEEGGKPPFPSCARHARTSAGVHENRTVNRGSTKEDNSRSAGIDNTAR